MLTRTRTTAILGRSLPSPPGRMDPSSIRKLKLQINPRAKSTSAHLDIERRCVVGGACQSPAVDGRYGEAPFATVPAILLSASVTPGLARFLFPKTRHHCLLASSCPVLPPYSSQLMFPCTTTFGLSLRVIVLSEGFELVHGQGGGPL